ncbi:hypothetical protein BKA65DRAFT_474209 [Rhexocercosporidium sp. MPI-PUGE-AT-0058]|nr:hypothetical protein BKA65DRAFT_474209 [Rhexocercosporidium sp. MPI-PUGE-AT-0058]
MTNTANFLPRTSPNFLPRKPPTRAFCFAVLELSLNPLSCAYPSILIIFSPVFQSLMYRTTRLTRNACSLRTTFLRSSIMAPNKCVKKGNGDSGGKKKTGKGKREGRENKNENGAQSSVSGPEVSERPSAPDIVAGVTAGEDNRLQPSVSGPEVSAAESSVPFRSVGQGSSGPMTFTDSSRISLTLFAFTAGHPLYDEYLLIPKGGTGKELSIRQLLILCIIADKEAAYLRASEFFAPASGLIRSKFASTRPDAAKNNEFSEKKITDKMLEEVSMVRADLRFASGGQSKKGEKLTEQDDAEMKDPEEAGEGRVNEIIPIQDGDETVSEADEEGNELDEQFMALQMAEFAAQEEEAANKHEKETNRGEKPTEPSSASSIPLANGIPTIISIVWLPSRDTEDFKAYRQANPIGDRDDESVEYQGAARMQLVGLTFPSFVLSV